jgi:hypothetical protein
MLKRPASGVWQSSVPPPERTVKAAPPVSAPISRDNLLGSAPMNSYDHKATKPVSLCSHRDGAACRQEWQPGPAAAARAR